MSSDAAAKDLATWPEDALLERVQHQTFRYFWEAAHPVSGLAFDRRHVDEDPATPGPAAVGGTGFAVLAILVATERRWITREAALERLGRMMKVLLRATCYHGALPHFIDGASGATVPFSRKDDGGDLIETALLCMGLLCAREYFDGVGAAERSLRAQINQLWEDVEWSWYTRGDRCLLYWHWSPNNGWAMDHEVRGWNECLIAYVLAAGAPRHPVSPLAYHRGFAAGREFVNGRSWLGIRLPLGMPYGGPLFFAHYSFCGIDPRGLRDAYADYWEQNRAHVRIHHAWCSANPHGFKGYGPECWGLTASDDPDGYLAHDPLHDNGTLAPTAALASYPYAPTECLAALRHFLEHHGERIWTRFGFSDAFCPQRDWYAKTCLAIDQGPIIALIENHRSALLWRLFMRVREVRTGLARLGFSSPWLA